MEIVALPLYIRQVKRLLTAAEREAMESAIASGPLSFPVVPRTGGFRKARWGRGNKGKSGGVRAVFYYFVAGTAVYLQYVYAKNEKENLTRDEEKQLSNLAAEIERAKAKESKER
jgi:hypothetical protein